MAKSSIQRLSAAYQQQCLLKRSRASKLLTMRAASASAGKCESQVGKNQASVMKSRTSASQFQNAQWGQKAPLALMNSLHNRRHRLQANPIRHNRHISLNPNRINTQAE